jgi:hypothetical protein
MGSLALLPFGYLLAGPVGEAVGSREVVVVGSAVGLVAIAAGLLARENRNLVSPADAAHPAAHPAGGVT